MFLVEFMWLNCPQVPSRSVYGHLPHLHMWIRSQKTFMRVSYVYSRSLVDGTRVTRERTEIKGDVVFTGEGHKAAHPWASLECCRSSRWVRDFSGKKWVWSVRREMWISPMVNSLCDLGQLPPCSGPCPHWQWEGLGFLRAQECYYLKFPSKFLIKNPTLERLWQQWATDSPAKCLHSRVMWERPQPPTPAIRMKMTEFAKGCSTDVSPTSWSKKKKVGVCVCDQGFGS